MEAEVIAEVVMAQQHALDAVAARDDVAVVADREAIAARLGDAVAEHRAVIERDQLPLPVEEQRLAGRVGDRGVGLAGIDGDVVEGEREAGIGEDGVMQAALVEQELGRRGGIRVGAEEGALAAGDVGPGGIAEAGLPVVIDIERDVAAPFAEITPDEEVEVLVRDVAPLAHAARGGEVEALKVVLEDDVDGARDRIGAVDRRTADRHHVDPIHQSGGDLPQIHGRALHRAEDRGGRRADEAVAVDQRQRALRAQIVEVGEGLPGAERALRSVRAVARAAEAGQLGQGIAQIGVAERGDGIRTHRGDRLRGDRGLRQARAGHHDHIAGPGLRRRYGIGRWSRRRIGWRCARLRERRGAVHQPCQCSAAQERTTRPYPS